MKPSENTVFSRRFACFMFQLYEFSLVFALTSRNKGLYLFESPILWRIKSSRCLRAKYTPRTNLRFVLRTSDI